jgi:hypothetical protein
LSSWIAQTEGGIVAGLSCRLTWPRPQMPALRRWWASWLGPLSHGQIVPFSAGGTVRRATVCRRSSLPPCDRAMIDLLQWSKLPALPPLSLLSSSLTSVKIVGSGYEQLCFGGALFVLGLCLAGFLLTRCYFGADGLGLLSWMAPVMDVPGLRADQSAAWVAVPEVPLAMSFSATSKEETARAQTAFIRLRQSSPSVAK